MYKEDLALNNLQGLICHKTQTERETIIYRCSHTFKKPTMAKFTSGINSSFQRPFLFFVLKRLKAIEVKSGYFFVKCKKKNPKKNK